MDAYNMNAIPEVIDLTSDDETTEKGPKRPRIEIPKTSPSISDGAPKLELAVPPANSEVSDVASVKSYSYGPPILQPEVELPIIIKNVHGGLPEQRITLTSSRTIGLVQNRVTETGSQPRSNDASPPRNQTNRIAKENASLSNVNRLTANVLNRTISAFKKIETENPNKVKGKGSLSIPKEVKNVGQSPQNRSARTKVHHTPDEIAKLEMLFASNPSPKRSDIYQIVWDTNLSIRNVKKWFAVRRRKTGVNVNSGGSGFPETQGSSRTSKGIPNNREANPKAKYIRSPEMRNQDIEAIKTDIENVKKCSLDTLRSILDPLWEIKADRILKLMINKKYGLKETIYKEARRIKELASDICLFSDEQESVISQWKERFLSKAIQEGLGSTDAKHNVNEIITPFIAPFVYSKTTVQDGRLLTLEVALHDFCKISNTNCNSSWEWKTPSYLQCNY